MSVPHIVILAGPNGAGKSTAAPLVLRDELSVTEFVNADVIARGLAGFDPDSAALLAGRIMLDRLDALAAARVNFAFETTLASRTFVPWIRERLVEGYSVHLFLVTLASPELAIERVRDRVRRGGHFVPDEIVRRRFQRGLHNFFELYRPLVTSWDVFDNSLAIGAQLVARGGADLEPTVVKPLKWKRIEEQAYGR
jgi:predicted ABC-type ATPase